MRSHRQGDRGRIPAQVALSILRGRSTAAANAVLNSSGDTASVVLQAYRRGGSPAQPKAFTGAGSVSCQKKGMINVLLIFQAGFVWQVGFFFLNKKIFLTVLV